VLRPAIRFVDRHPVAALGGTALAVVVLVVLVAWASGPATAAHAGIEDLAPGEPHTNEEMTMRVTGAQTARTVPGYLPDSEDAELLAVDMTIENRTDAPIVSAGNVVSAQIDGQAYLDYGFVSPDGTAHEAFQPGLAQEVRLVFELPPGTAAPGQDVSVGLWDRELVEEQGYLPRWDNPTPAAVVRLTVSEGQG